MGITVGYSTRKPNPEFIEYIKKSSGFKKIQVIEKINTGDRSLSSVYNEIISESENDIVVLCHDDIYFDTTSWYHKLIKHFEKSVFGILGVAGTTFLPKSGMWWEDRKKMYGIVNHEHEGKKWESKYSSSIGNKIQECVVVDGLFIAINKKKIKKEFDESVLGFHFYDVEFCFRNFIEGVKIGIITNIRLTHKSVGITNEQWESNRASFSEKYQNNLPSYIPYKENDSFKILVNTSISESLDNLNFLIDSAQKTNSEIAIISEKNKDLKNKIKKQTIVSYDLNEPPGYKIGDGKWSMNTNNGPQISQTGVLYKISEPKYDIIVCQDKKNISKICKLYPEIPKIVLDSNTDVKGHTSIKKQVPVELFLTNINKQISEILNNDFLPKKKNKIKIISGYSDRGGSTIANINLTNYLNSSGYDCTFYGPHDYHIDKCKSGFSNELVFEQDDILICHVINLPARPNVKKVIYTCHEKWWFDFTKINWYWDIAIFLHEEHRKYHSKYTKEYEIIPNFKEDLKSSDKSNIDLIAGIIGSIEDRKQTHVSIKRAISDGCEKVFVYGQINDKKYFEYHVQPLVDNQKVFMMGHTSNKQEIYDSIGRVYHSSKGEVACLVKDECYLTNTKFFGNSETDNEVSRLTNEEILNLWKKIID